jgi:hypothetical protein
MSSSSRSGRLWIATPPGAPALNRDETLVLQQRLTSQQGVHVGEP